VHRWGAPHFNFWRAEMAAHSPSSRPFGSSSPSCRRSRVVSGSRHSGNVVLSASNPDRIGRAVISRGTASGRLRPSPTASRSADQQATVASRMSSTGSPWPKPVFSITSNSEKTERALAAAPCAPASMTSGESLARRPARRNTLRGAPHAPHLAIRGASGEAHQFP
jgi:hypothetical protein